MDSPSTIPWLTRLGRFSVVALLVVRVYSGYKLRQLFGLATGRRNEPDFYDARHLRSACLLRDTAIRLEGLLIKVCQFIGTRADVLPPEFVRVLAELQDRVPPKPFELLRPRLEETLACRIEERFTEFDPKPVASASLAQVHRGVLDDGREVAVKIQYPGIAELVESDLATFGFFIRALARIEPFFDFRFLLQEIETYIPAELNFVGEAAHARRFAENFADDESITFPKPIEELSSATVLIMSFEPGVKVNDLAGLEAQGTDKQTVATLLTGAYLRQILEHGFFHGDPHPGNLLVRPGPVLVILDLGLAKELSRDTRIAFLKLTAAIIGRDAKTIGACFRDLGFETREGGDDTFVTLAELMLGQAFEAKQAYADAAMMDRIGDELMAALRANPLVRASSDPLLIMRVMGLLSGIGKQLDSKVNPLAAILPFVTRALGVKPPTKEGPPASGGDPAGAD